MSAQLGRFITLEGGEGVGKSTLLKGLSSWLEGHGFKVVVTREPGGTLLGEAIRSLLFGQNLQPTSYAELFLMMSGRVQHIEEKILPSLERGDWVICDRYIDSSRVYQGICGAVDLYAIDSMWREIVRKFPRAEPDRTLILDCAVESSLLRIKQRQSESNRFDSAQELFHKEIRQGFLRVASLYSTRCKVVDASKQVSELLQSAQYALQDLLIPS